MPLLGANPVCLVEFRRKVLVLKIIVEKEERR
jgi:hypothetical protein